MPSITIPNQVMKQVKEKRGLYSVLSKKEIEKIEKSLKEAVTDIVKSAFMEYAKAHKCAPEMLSVEWNRFNKFLQKKL